jgi:hypothetical protein
MREPTPFAPRPRPAGRWALVALAAFMASCADPDREPAARAIAEIEATLRAAGTAPAKYIPGQLEDVQTGVTELKQEFEDARYDAVLAEAPQVLAAAQALAPEAQSRETELIASLRAEWAALVETVPAELTAVAARVDAMGPAGRLPEGLTARDLTGARQRLDDARTLWDRALKERDADRFPEAVTLANQVRDLVRQVAAVPGLGAGGAPVK